MKTLKLTCFIILLSLAGIAQNKTLVADETELVMLKSSFKIECSNDKLFKLMYDEFKGLGFRFTATIKQDRTGLYTMYSVPFKMEQLERVKQFFIKIK